MYQAEVGISNNKYILEQTNKMTRHMTQKISQQNEKQKGKDSINVLTQYSAPEQHDVLKQPNVH